MPEFRHPTRNTLYLRGLFIEKTGDITTALYTLKDEDYTVGGITYPSLYKLYLKVGDPKELRFAKKYLESWEHWQILCQCSWFQKHVSRWREELELQLVSEAIEAIREKAIGGDITAAKFMASKDWKDNAEVPLKRGRPKKLSIHEASTIVEVEEQKLREDFDRLMNQAGTVQ